MKPEEIILSDWQRILFGEVPAAFFLEVVIRTVFIFLLLITSMRLLGRRMAAQLNRTEMVAMFSLAAAIGVPLQAPDRGLLPAVVIAVVVVLVGRLLARLTLKSQSFQASVEDDLAILANDGVLDLQTIKVTRLSVERVLAQLRSERVRHLGEVRRLYIESNGSFSLVKEAAPSYGLSVLPAFDQAFVDEQTKAAEKVCGVCGNRQEKNAAKETCGNCGNKSWVNGIY